MRTPAWLEIYALNPAHQNDPRWKSLDPGERATLALALGVKPSAVLIDERAGTSIARQLRLPVTGTLGILDEAARRKYISLPDAVQRLAKTSFRYPRAIVARLLAEDARRA